MMRRFLLPAARPVRRKSARLSIQPLESRDVPAPFTAGNIVVYRVGDGGAATTSAAAPVFLDEYTPATPTWTLVQSVPMPVADSGANQMLTGYVQEVSRDVFSEANRHQMSVSLLETAPALVGVLKPAERARIRDMILAAAKPKSPQLVEDLAKLAEMMADQRCEKLCRF